MEISYLLYQLGKFQRCPCNNMNMEHYGIDMTGTTRPVFGLKKPEIVQGFKLR